MSGSSPSLPKLEVQRPTKALNHLPHHCGWASKFARICWKRGCWRIPCHHVHLQPALVAAPMAAVSFKVRHTRAAWQAASGVDMEVLCAQRNLQRKHCRVGCWGALNGPYNLCSPCMWEMRVAPKERILHTCRPRGLSTWSTWLAGMDWRGYQLTTGRQGC